MSARDAGGADSGPGPAPADELEAGQRQAELAERTLRAAYDSALDPHVLYEAIRDASGQIIDFRFVDANPAACEYNQWDRERLIGTTLLDQWPDFASDPTREAYAQVLVTGEPLTLDDAAWVQERLFGGQLRHYDLRAVRVSDSLLSVTWRDITDRREAAEHDRRMAAVVAQSTEAIIVTDFPSGNVTLWNPAAERMYGYTAAEMLGKSAYLLTPPEERARLHELAGALGTGESIPDFDGYRYRKDGTLIPVSISAAAIRDDEDKVIGLVSFHRDIRERVKVEKEIEESKNRALEKVAELEQYQQLTVGRELRMIELKKEIEYLKKSGPARRGDPDSES